MCKTGIMGGTFNPVHNGHLSLASTALNQIGLDEVIFIPSGSPAYKNNNVILPGSMRKEMLEIACASDLRFSVSDIEIKRQGATYTIDTLDELIKMGYKDMYFIMGADQIVNFHKWHMYEKIFEKCTLLVAYRDDNDNKRLLGVVKDFKESYNAKIELLDMPRKAVSSSDIRKRLIHGESVNDMMPQSVCDYIEKNKSYILECFGNDK